jgi:nucleoside-diphosphate-sugar epimerase
MTEKKITVAIIGAAGFVGMELVKAMHLNNKYNLFAITRGNNAPFLLEGKNINIVNNENIPVGVNFDVVINLAYPNNMLPHYYPDANNKILNIIKSISTSNTQIIQISSLAVFGFGLDIDIVGTPIPNRRDYSYTETKLEMENLLIEAFPNNVVSIVRLGNVWGVGSATWTFAFCDKLLFGQYVGVENKDGYSNITDVKNVVSYIEFLANRGDLKGVNVWHLAEFSSIKWSQIISLIANELNVEPVYSDVEPNYTRIVRDDLSSLFKLPSISAKYKAQYGERFSGSYIRSMVRVLIKLFGKEKAKRLKKQSVMPLPQKAHLGVSDSVFLTVITAPVEFKSITHTGWEPIINFDESWNSVKSWMGDAGYVNHTYNNNADD